jgi:hypothetical protein
MFVNVGPGNCQISVRKERLELASCLGGRLLAASTVTVAFVSFTRRVRMHTFARKNLRLIHYSFVDVSEEEIKEDIEVKSPLNRLI